MSQSDYVFAFLFLAYLAFITLRGELPKYAGFILMSGPGATPQANQQTLHDILVGGTSATAIY